MKRVKKAIKNARSTNPLKADPDAPSPGSHSSAPPAKSDHRRP
jgi:hypothetical protein